MQAAPPVFRFAPSPTGYLHLGHALSAGLNARLATERGGRFLLRIEDIDPTRRRPDHVAAITQDLAWLGLRWEEPVLHQSSRMAAYRTGLEALKARGLVYPCFCSRKALALQHAALGPDHPCDPDGVPLYPGICRNLPDDERDDRIRSGQDHAWRLDMARALCGVNGPLSYLVEHADGRIETRLADPARWGDVVIARRETPTSYHLAVTLDDAHQAVTHVVRGRDLEACTDIHRLLQEVLGLPVPVYRFHDLLTGPDGRKLSKSQNAPSIRSLRASGLTPAQLWAMTGLSPAPATTASPTS
jgi:glutamyl-Q tRNA(Asp) synthetase